MYREPLTAADIVEAFQVMIDQGWTKKEIDQLWAEAKEIIDNERNN